MPPGRLDHPGGGKSRTILPPPTMKQTTLTARQTAAALALALAAVAAGVAVCKAFAAILWAFYHAGALM